MAMKRYGTSHSNKDWKCNSCKNVFQSVALINCPQCNSSKVEPIPDAMTDPSKQLEF